MTLAQKWYRSHPCVAQRHPQFLRSINHYLSLKTPYLENVHRLYHMRGLELHNVEKNISDRLGVAELTENCIQIVHIVPNLVECDTLVNQQFAILPDRVALEEGFNLPCWVQKVVISLLAIGILSWEDGNLGICFGHVYLIHDLRHSILQGGDDVRVEYVLHHEITIFLVPLHMLRGTVLQDLKSIIVKFDIPSVSLARPPASRASGASLRWWREIFKRVWEEQMTI